MTGPNMEPVDYMLDKEDRWAKEDDEPRPYQERIALCYRCGLWTAQVYSPNRRGWICEDDGKGCGQRVISKEKLAELRASSASITAEDLRGE